MADFIEQLIEALEAEDPLDAGTVLVEVEEWDSLGTLAVVSMVSDEYGVSLASEELVAVQTVADLWQLVQSKSEG